MSLTRSGFLRVAGISLLVLAGKKFAGAVSGAVQKAAPRAARRWAMAIDVSKCLEKNGCTRCIDACHLAHNVPALPDRRHEVAWIWKVRFEDAFPSDPGQYAGEQLRGRPLPILCNHCAQPPCVRVCPAQATWKREDDGIVMMDWHRCIGCRYCIAACPYGSRSFNWVDPRPYIRALNADFPTRTKGVVEKCNFCEERLAQGRPPACVEACPAKAMVFGDLNDSRSAVRELLRARYAIRRKPELGTNPSIFYIV